MIELQNHTLTEKFRETSSSIIYRGYRRGYQTADRIPVLVKVPQGEYPTTRECAQIEHEYRILASIDLPGVIKVFGLERLERSPAIVMEDFAGQSLSAVLATLRNDLRAVLRTALALASTLAELHAQQILHKDVKPHNIVCNVATGQVKLLDFGLATRLGQEIPRLVRPDALEGTLAYISPEQTGRMNRGIDHRADLYSLGVTLYEMLTGRLPFENEDPMELVHSHLARNPLPPCELVPALPKVISDVVMRLLEKAPEDRYQRAAGLAVDLGKCLERLDREGTIAPFPLCHEDKGNVLSIPQKLYGRESQLAALLASFEQAAAGQRALLLVAGHAGVGKSALVHEIHKAIARRGGEFIAGKFEQLHRSVPFTAFIQAFRDLIRQLLTESPAALAAWRTELLAALGVRGGVLMDLLPELALIIGPQPAVAPLEPTEARNRLGAVLQSFVRVFCTPGHPLILFLDDLQWADPASLLFLQFLLTDPAGGHLLVIGAYRDHEVDAAHPLRDTLRELANAGLTPTEITLAALDPPSVRALVADTLGGTDAADARLDWLAQELFAKTHGNPFFLNQLLVSWHKDGLLFRDSDTGRWTWDPARIAAAQITDNVVEFMAGKLQKLDPGTQRVLSLAACMGHSFDLAGLAKIDERPPAAVAFDLWAALREGLVVPLDTDYRLLPTPSSAPGESSGTTINAAYRFLHDRVQQAAYLLIAPERRQDVHLRIGRILHAKLPREPLAQELFNLVYHWNLGAALITDSAERRALAQANLLAGRMAKARAAYSAGASFLDAGVATLGLLSREALDDLAYTLYHERAECFYLAGRHDEADREIAFLLAQARSNEERIHAYNLRIALCMMLGRFPEGLAAGRAALHLLGVTLPEAPEQFQEEIARELQIIDEHFAKRPIETLSELPIRPAGQELASKLLVTMMPIAYWIDPRLAAIISSKLLVIALSQGNSIYSVWGYVMHCFFIRGVLGRIEEANRLVHLVKKLLRKLSAPDLEAKCTFMLGLSIGFAEPLGAVVDCLRRAQEAGMEYGDFMYASHAAGHLPVACYERGDALESVEAEIHKSTAILNRTQEKVARGFLEVMRQTVACLRGRTHGRSTLCDDAFGDVAWLEAAKSKGELSAIFLYHLHKLEISFLYGEIESALAAARCAEETASSVLGVYWQLDLYFWASLAMAARYPAVDRPEQERLYAAISEYQTRIVALAAYCPANEAHRHTLIAAELARLQGDNTRAAELYDQAIDLAHQHGFQQHEALANELCAKFYLSRRRSKLARVYLAEACYDYSRWGATPKVAELHQRYADLLPAARMEEARTVHDNGAPSSIPANDTRMMAGSALDMAAVLKVAQALGSEIVLDRLFDRMMRIVIASAGAPAGALILQRDGHLFLVATATVNPERVTVGLDEPIAGSTTLPLTVIQYVARTMEPLVLAAPERDPRFGEDPYIVQHRPKSILTLPLMHQGRVAGVLHLENNAISDAFPRARVELLTALSALAAIAVENALLYANVQAVSADLKHSNEQLQAAKERLEGELESRAQMQEAHARMQDQIIQAQERRLSELSTPLIPISDHVMVMPLIGTIDPLRADQMLETSLAGAQASRAKVVIIDITGVQMVEGGVATSLAKLAAALRLLGTHVILTGIRPLVARSLVDLGTDMGAIEIRSALNIGIASALARTGEVAILQTARPSQSQRR